MNVCALCVYVYFVCFLLPYLTLLIFYQLNELLFPSCCKNFHNAATMKSFKAEISDNS